MAIHFKCVRWKNFLSTGNSFIEICLENDGKTLIVGENGAGKSIMLDALCFSLFNKSFRGVNKPNLINSINEQDCVVECEFRVGKTDYLVRRGLKPSIFEIFQNGKLFDQSSTTKDYQRYLEQNILKMNFKSFTQIVVLGSSNFIPFMQLSAADRRYVIEDLLDIQIFSQMNVILKAWIATNKQERKDYEYKISVIEEKIELQKNHIAKLEKLSQEDLESSKEEIELSKSKIKELLSEIDDIQKKINTLQEQISKYDELASSYSKMETFEKSLHKKKKEIAESIKFYEENNTCPTCTQTINEDFKRKVSSKHKNDALNVEKKLDDLKEIMEATFDKLTKFTAIQSDITKYQTSISEKNSVVYGLNQYIQTLEKSLVEEESHVSDEDINKLEGFICDKESEKNRLSDLNDDMEYYKMAESLIKDKGIKSKIIQQYLPIINKLLNKYLRALDFFITFNLDENFKETAKSRCRDEFSYLNFSEGEKFRINIAILLTWRDIAKMKNSASTNILILDEVFDSSLDPSGVDELMKLLELVSNDNTSVFVITHRGDSMIDKFENVLEFRIKKDFTCIEDRS